jgi:hypothetical protein
MEAVMAPIGSYTAFAGIHTGDGWRLLRNLVGGLIIFAVWLSLWTWLALGVVRPLSHLAGAPARPAAEERF